MTNKRSTYRTRFSRKDKIQICKCRFQRRLQRRALVTLEERRIHHSLLAISWHRLHKSPPERPSNPYVSPLVATCWSLSLPPNPCVCELAGPSLGYPWSKGLYRAPSNLPELLVVVLCKRPHFVSDSACRGSSSAGVLCLTARHGEAEEHAPRSAESPPVCSHTTYAASVEHVFSSGQDRSVCQRRTFP